MLCIIGLLLNIVPAYIAQKLGAPIWLDTIGTIFVAVIGGYLPGILIGFLTNLINAVLVDFSFIYYSVISVWIALISTYFYNKGFLYRFRTLWPLFFIFPLVATIFDRMISWVLEGELKGNFMSGLCIEFFDKGAVLCLVLLIFNLMPKRWRSALRIAFWQQKPLSRDEALKTKNLECRTVSIRTKMIMIIVGAMILVSAVSTLISAVLYHNYMVSEYSHTAQKVAYETSKLLDASRLDEYAEKNFEDQDYRQIKRDMLLIRSTTPHIEYLYVYKILDNIVKVICNLSDSSKLVLKASNTSDDVSVLFLNESEGFFNCLNSFYRYCFLCLKLILLLYGETSDFLERSKLFFHGLCRLLRFFFNGLIITVFVPKHLLYLLITQIRRRP